MRTLGKPPRWIAIVVAVAAFVLARSSVAAVVWAIDDGETIRQGDTSLPFKTGVDNPVWRPGEPIRLFALRDEVVAFQIVIEADTAPLEGVRVELSPFEGAGIAVERFVEHFFEIRHPSSTSGRSDSLGWAAGSGPPAGRYTGTVPDALIPVELAPPWAAWPLRVAQGQNGLVWIDLTVPVDLPPATYRSRVIVSGAAGALADIPLELEVLDATMPARPVGTMLFYDRDTLEHRIGDPEVAERQLWTLFHAHRLAPLHGVQSVGGVRKHLPALDGSLYTAEAGYRGPARGLGDGILVLGTYGTFGDAGPESLAEVERVADEIAAHGLFDRADVVLYAADENCTSERGAGWRSALRGSGNPNARRVRVGWTCSADPAGQPVDVPMVLADSFDPKLVAVASAAGKETWIYNGVRPATGTVLTDTEAVSMRTLGWIGAMAGIPRWFLWETTAWSDGNRGGHGPFDPFVTAETFHNEDGEASMGDGVLVYPGRQLQRFGEHSLGFVGMLPSIRLKNLRRGIEDAGYYQLARGAASGEAQTIARQLFPRILGEARTGRMPSWSERGAPFFQARRALASLIAPGADPGPVPGVGASSFLTRFKFRKRYLAGAALVVAVAAAFFLRRRRSRKV